MNSKAMRGTFRSFEKQLCHKVCFTRIICVDDLRSFSELLSEYLEKISKRKKKEKYRNGPKEIRSCLIEILIEHDFFDISLTGRH